jgi:hypothetical protein
MAIRLPPLKIDYLRSFTDDTGIFQHAKYCIPKRSEGYTTDDNARALIACTKYHRLKKDSAMKTLANVYLAFLNHMQKSDGNFHNYLSYERTFLDVDGSEDCKGRSLLACGIVMNSNLPKDMQMVAKDIFDRGFPWVWKSVSARYLSFAILGLFEYSQTSPQGDLKVKAEKLGDSLVQCYQNEAGDDWHWFEPHLTYDNARLTDALFATYRMVGDKKYLDVAAESMDFLLKTQMVEGVFVPVGNDGWFKCGENRAFYDQQPLEASAMVEAAIDAYYATKNKRYMQFAHQVFGWFLGENSCKLVLYNSETGGCFDGLASDKVNLNQGGESLVSYLLARLRLEELKRGF